MGALSGTINNAITATVMSKLIPAQTSPFPQSVEVYPMFPDTFHHMFPIVVRRLVPSPMHRQTSVQKQKPRGNNTSSLRSSFLHKWGRYWLRHQSSFLLTSDRLLIRISWH